MKPKKIIEEFGFIAKELGIRIIKDKGNFSGGFCLLKKEKIIVVNKNQPLEQRVRSLCKAFSKLDISTIYIKPIIRKMIKAESDSSQLYLIK